MPGRDAGHEPSVIVTGGARGIGEALVRRTVAAGGRVVFSDIDAERGTVLSIELGDRAQFIRADARDEDDVARMFTLAADWLGTIDAVFANAGAVGVTGPIAETPVSAFRDTVDVLLTSVFLAFKHGVRAMAPGRHGALVATASVASLRGGLGPHAYTAAKAGVRGLVESTAAEVAPLGLTANAVAPGGTVSSLSAGLYGDPDDTEVAYAHLAAKSSSGVPTTADDVARAAEFLAFGPARINGTCLVIDGGDDVLGHSAAAFYEPPATRAAGPEHSSRKGDTDVL